jgi:hypothetical protein
MANRKRTKRTIAQGRVVEQVVAKLYENEYPNSTVRHNVRLPAKHNPKRKRQIDVLLSTVIANIPIQIAFECKNEKSSIGVEKIESFIAKLNYLGIPPQHGIYVAASGYTIGAIERAEEDGVQTLTLLGLTADRLDSAVTQAVQAVVYLLADVTLIRVRNEVDHAEDPGDILSFRDSQGQVCGSIPDLIWYKWVTGQIPYELGEHPVQVDFPSSWHYVVNGKEEKLLGTEINVRVYGVVITIPGRATDHTLVDARNQQLDKRQIHVEYEQLVPGTRLPVTMVTSEQELEELCSRLGSVSLTIGRIPLPRIRLMKTYYPFSERVARILYEAKKAMLEGRIPQNHDAFTFEKLEGTDLGTVFEPIWLNHPTAGTDNHATG